MTVEDAPKAEGRCPACGGPTTDGSMDPLKCERVVGMVELTARIQYTRAAARGIQ